MNFVISVSHSGYAETEYDGNVRIFKPHNIAIVYPGHVLYAHYISPDYNVTNIVVSPEMFGKLGVHKMNLNRFIYEIQPEVRLSHNRYHDVMNVIASMRSVCHLNNESRSEMLISLLYVLIQMIDTFRKEDNNNTENIQTPLSTKLYEQLSKHCREHRDVTYYAEYFHLSPKYFSSAIKRETGYNVGHWIRMYVIADAKMMLRMKTDLSLQEISELMGFLDIATFSRYFKRETGITPSDFRKK